MVFLSMYCAWSGLWEALKEEVFWNSTICISRTVRTGDTRWWVHPSFRTNSLSLGHSLWGLGVSTNLPSAVYKIGRPFHYQLNPKPSFYTTSSRQKSRLLKAPSGIGIHVDNHLTPPPPAYSVRRHFSYFYFTILSSTSCQYFPNSKEPRGSRSSEVTWIEGAFIPLLFLTIIEFQEKLD